MSTVTTTKLQPPLGPPQIVEVRVHALEEVTDPRALPPTDVMFANGKAFHNALGSGAVEHEQAHLLDPLTVVRLRRGVDQVRWRTNGPITVVSIRRHHHDSHVHDNATDEAHGDPHNNPFPFTPPVAGGAPNGVLSGKPRPDADLGRYKVTFRVRGVLVDPDVEIFP